MIWSRGELIPDESLRISVLDRTFEHGLGLFETFRTWNGHATLLGRHLDRMVRSAGALGLDLDPRDLPDETAVIRLLRAVEPAESSDLRFRLILSGGLSASSSASRLWMTAGPLAPTSPHRGVCCIHRSILADPADPLARHKTLNYWRRRIEQERAAAEGADEVVCVTPDGLICEGTRSNLFLVRGGVLITPGIDGPLLDGIMRRVVIERARKMDIEVVEGPVPLGAIDAATEAFLTNSVRGILPVARLLHAGWSAPGLLTRRLWETILPWLRSGGTTP